MESVIVILGTTAAGKSGVAVEIAKKIDGEVISADSRQVYKGLDIGTGKITKKEMKGVPHHLLDVANLKRQFSVAEYKELAERKIREIIARGKTPIICGGTGFYIDAITKGLILPEVPPNKRLRKSLDRETTQALFNMLKNLDRDRAKNIDPKNKVRLIRAIEIAKNLGKVPALKKKSLHYEFIKIGLKIPEEELKNKINKRVKKMFEDGLLEEVKKLKRSGIKNKRLQELGFEYFHPTKKKVRVATFQYAKRQMTWFKRDKEIKWFKPEEYKEIKKYLEKKLYNF